MANHSLQESGEVKIFNRTHCHLEKKKGILLVRKKGFCFKQPAVSITLLPGAWAHVALPQQALTHATETPHQTDNTV